MRAPVITRGRPTTGAGQGSGIAAVVLALVSFSWGFVLVKVLPLQAAPIAAWRLAIGGLVLLGAVALLRVRWPATWLAPILAGLAFGTHQLLYRSSSACSPCSRSDRATATCWSTGRIAACRRR